MMAEVGYCNGIEIYSRHLTGRMPGEAPPCLFDYLPPDALLVVDESHVTVPQIGAMYKGDRSRKETLVERSEEHTSELQALMRISYAVFCLKKTKTTVRET